ncbi:MAG: right-handed parallel beta-helix repeat-containing protein [Phycisphaerae bacterium]
MRSSTRSRRKSRTPLLTATLVVGAFVGVQVATRDQHPEASAGTGPLRPLVVSSPHPGRSTDTAHLTLIDALIEARQDPHDNVIQFDPEVFKSSKLSIHLSEPLVINDESGGDDRIDGALPDGFVTLDGSDCPDAGIMVSGKARFSLMNLGVRGGRLRGILVSANAKLNLDNVLLRDSLGPGVAVFGEARVHVRGGSINTNGSHGVEVRDRASTGLEDVRLVGNGQSDVAGFNQAGIFASGCQMLSAADWNVVLSDEAQAVLTRCTLSRARFANADASGKAMLRVADSTIDESGRTGIFATGHAVIDLTSTRLRRHASRCIELQDGAVATIEASTMEYGGEYGMVLFGKSSVRATQVRIADNGSHGVCLRQEARGWFDRCTFTGNRRSGIACPDANEGGLVRASRCSFSGNGMRPICRGPLHISPLVPTPIHIDGPQVTCMTEPNATIELYIDRAGEAGRFLKTVTADGMGRFTVDCRDVPAGHVITAAATSAESTSEFNVVAGTDCGPILSALLGDTGPLSDKGGPICPESLIRRWEAGTRLVFNVANPPNSAVERYVRFLVDRINDWTGTSLRSELGIGQVRRPPTNAVVLPIRYVTADSPTLVGRGGATFMKWDAGGLFMPPMEVVLAIGQDPRQTCPRVLAHEIGHTLGLCHARVGLLSRMQGITPPPKDSGYLNDFSPMMTYYDVLALQILHDRRNSGRLTVGQLMEKGAISNGAAGVLETGTVSR